MDLELHLGKTFFYVLNSNQLLQCVYKHLIPVNGMEPTLNEIDLDESLGFFFRRLGEIAFSDESRSQYPGSASSVAVASNQGCVFFSDANGEYRSCQTFQSPQ